MVLMLAGKGITIATPFVFKALVDSMGSGSIPPAFASAPPDALINTFLLSSLLLYGMPSLPAFLILSYGKNTCRKLRASAFKRY